MQTVLSVIVPVYNAGQFINELIELFGCCKNNNVEFIFVDDGSKDNSYEIIQKAISKDCRMKVIHKENGGVSTARNLGITVAAGQYIWFVDADDSVEECAVDRICEMTASGLDLYVFDAVSVGQNKRSLLCGFEGEGFTLVADAATFMLESFMTSSKGSAVWNKVLKKEIITENSIMFPEGITNGEDGMFLMDYYDKIQSVQYVKQALYYYVNNGGSATGNIRPETFNSYIAAYKKRMDYAEKYNLEAVKAELRKQLVQANFRRFTHIKRNKKIKDKNALKRCIQDITENDYITEEYKKVGNIFKGKIKRYYDLHMKKNINGIYSMVCLQAMEYDLKAFIFKLLKR